MTDQTFQARAALAVVDPTHDTPETVHPDLATILSWPRPHGSPAELDFCQWVKSKVAAMTGKPVTMLAEGSFYVQIEAKKGLQPTVLFSCHLDTVDSQGDGSLVDGKVQRKGLTYDPNFGQIALESESKSGCLGADDGAGVWLLLQMIDQNKPGTYIFHRGEERGGISAHANLKAHLQFLTKFDIAVAFDRPRNNEVITHQGGQECASDKCALALCAALNKHGMGYSPSPRGSFTDTKVYRGVIAECFNMGVGYESQHSRSETQDYGHLVAMLNAIMLIDWESLPVDRDPAKPDPQDAWRGHVGGYPGRSYGGFGMQRQFGEDFADYKAGGYPNKGKGKKPKVKAVPKAPVEPDLFGELKNNTREDLMVWVETEPEAVIDALIEMILEVGRLRSDVEILKLVSGVTHD